MQGAARGVGGVSSASGWPPMQEIWVDTVAHPLERALYVPLAEATMKTVLRSAVVNSWGRAGSPFGPPAVVARVDESGVGGWVRDQRMRDARVAASVPLAYSAEVERTREGHLSRSQCDVARVGHKMAEWTLGGLRASFRSADWDRAIKVAEEVSAWSATLVLVQEATRRLDALFQMPRGGAGAGAGALEGRVEELCRRVLEPWAATLVANLPVWGAEGGAERVGECRMVRGMQQIVAAFQRLVGAGRVEASRRLRLLGDHATHMSRIEGANLRRQTGNDAGVRTLLMAQCLQAAMSEGTEPVTELARCYVKGKEELGCMPVRLARGNIASEETLREQSVSGCKIASLVWQMKSVLAHGRPQVVVVSQWERSLTAAHQALALANVSARVIRGTARQRYGERPLGVTLSGAEVSTLNHFQAGYFPVLLLSADAACGMTSHLGGPAGPWVTHQFKWRSGQNTRPEIAASVVVFLDPPGEDAADGARRMQSALNFLQGWPAVARLTVARYCATHTCERRLWTEIEVAQAAQARQVQDEATRRWVGQMSHPRGAAIRPKVRANDSAQASVAKRPRAEESVKTEADESDVEVVVGKALTMDEVEEIKWKKARTSGGIISLDSSDDEDEKPDTAAVPSPRVEETPAAASPGAGVAVPGEGIAPSVGVNPALDAPLAVPPASLAPMAYAEDSSPTNAADKNSALEMQQASAGTQVPGASETGATGTEGTPPLNDASAAHVTPGSPRAPSSTACSTPQFSPDPSPGGETSTAPTGGACTALAEVAEAMTSPTAMPCAAAPSEMASAVPAAAPPAEGQCVGPHVEVTPQAQDRIASALENLNATLKPTDSSTAGRSAESASEQEAALANLDAAIEAGLRAAPVPVAQVASSLPTVEASAAPVAKASEATTASVAPGEETGPGAIMSSGVASITQAPAVQVREPNDGQAGQDAAPKPACGDEGCLGCYLYGHAGTWCAQEFDAPLHPTVSSHLAVTPPSAHTMHRSEVRPSATPQRNSAWHPPSDVIDLTSDTDEEEGGGVSSGAAQRPLDEVEMGLLTHLLTGSVRPPDLAQPVQAKPAQEKPAQEKPAQEKPAQEKPAQEKPAADPWSAFGVRIRHAHTFGIFKDNALVMSVLSHLAHSRPVTWEDWHRASRCISRETLLHVCMQCGLTRSGNKPVLASRIHHYFFEPLL